MTRVPAESRQRRRSAWTQVWALPTYKPPWLERGISPQLVRAVESGRCRPPGRVLDIGCGEGHVAAWFAEQGFTALGFDFAPTVIQRARAAHSGVDRLRYEVVDVLCGRIPGGPFDILVDRGCFHGIPEADRVAYVRTVAAAAAPGAPFFLYVRAFRGDLPIKEEEEQKMLLGRIRELFKADFQLVRWSRCDIGRGCDRSASRPLPGLFILMRRRSAT